MGVEEAPLQGVMTHVGTLSKLTPSGPEHPVHTASDTQANTTFTEKTYLK